MTDFCATCGDMTTPPGVSPLGPLPPCHANTCSIVWTDPRVTSPPGRIEAAVRIHPAGGVECLADGTGTGLAVRTYGGELAIPSGCTPSGPYRDPVTNRLWMPPTSLCVNESSTGGGCMSTAPGGSKDETHSGCVDAVSVTIANTHCSESLTVAPEISLLGAELDGGTATYEFGVTGATPAVVPVFTSRRRPTTTHVPGDSIGHSVSQPELATYSGVIRLDPVTIAPGGSITVSVKPRVRYRADGTDAIDVTWGQYTLSLAGRTC